VGGVPLGRAELAATINPESRLFFHAVVEPASDTGHVEVKGSVPLKLEPAQAEGGGAPGYAGGTLGPAGTSRRARGGRGGAQGGGGGGREKGVEGLGAGTGVGAGEEEGQGPGGGRKATGRRVVGACCGA